MSEQNTEQAIRVRQITDVHANRSSQGEMQDGKFSYGRSWTTGPKNPDGGPFEPGQKWRTPLLQRGPSATEKFSVVHVPAMHAPW